MPRPHTTSRSIWRLLAFFMVMASGVLVAPTTAYANRTSSPYAFEEPSSPGTDVDGNNSGATANPGVIPSTNVVDPVGTTLNPLLPSVAETDLPSGGAVSDPAVDPQTAQPGGLARTGVEGLTYRIALAMMLVAVGFLAKEASGRRRVLAR